MINANYLSIQQVKQQLNEDLDQWASSRETHLAVAAAIHAISDDKRDPQAIWEAPTKDEWDNVVSAVEQYIRDDEAVAEETGRYQWGYEAIEFTVCETADGWTLHAPDASDEDIASGDAPYIVSIAREG